MRAAAALVVAAVAAAACGTPRVHVATGTTIGLKATPGDGHTRPPSVVLGYRRGEAALVPTEGKGGTAATDASSVLASLHFSTRWFGRTTLDSVIATGGAAVPLAQPTSEFSQALAVATLGVVPDEVLDRQRRLVGLLGNLTEAEAAQVLQELGLPLRQGKNARFSLQDYIARADSEPALQSLEAAFLRRRP